MPMLEQVQTAMMQAIDGGPAFLPDDLFAGTRARIVTGMKVHANTISHARLVAIEETFPRTLSALGKARFNRLSRDYLEQPGVCALGLNRIGALLHEWLRNCGEVSEDVFELARFEWRWLEAYHAADAEPLKLAVLAGLDADALLDVTIAAHPAAVVEAFARGIHHALGTQSPELAESATILIARPETEVLLVPASAAMVAIFGRLGKPVSIGNLLGLCTEPAGKDALSSEDFIAALIALLEAGALIRAEQQQVV